VDFQDSRVIPAFVEAYWLLVARPERFGQVVWKFGGVLENGKINCNFGASIGF